MVKKLLLLLFALNCMVGFAQKFSFVDAEGCSYSFRVTSTENHEVALVSASQADETAYPYKDKQHGLFTYYLLKKTAGVRWQLYNGGTI